MRLRIIIDPDPAPNAIPALELFNSVMVDHRPKFQALLGSLAVHIVMLAMIAAGSRYLSWYHEDDLDWSRYRVEPLRLHLGEPIYFNASASANPPEVEAHADESAVKAKAHFAVPDGLELPSVRAAVNDSPIVIQPDVQPQTGPPPTALPPLAFWARQAPDLPKPRPREVVVPGRTEAPSPAPKPGRPPVLAVPNRESAAADVNIAMPQTEAQAPPALPVPNTATAPVRILGVTEPRTASFDVVSGQPVNIIALAAQRSNARNVEIPRGLQNVPTSGSGTGAGPAQGTERDRSPGQASTELRPSAAQPSGVSSSPQTASGRPRAANTPSSAGSAPDGAAPAHPRAPSDLDVIRIQHPSNGRFDVVIMQSVARDDSPDLAGMLTGSPVYTVYLGVGDRKEWLMEYCVPARESRQAGSYQLDLDDVGAVTPPYPISTIIPDAIRTQQTAKRIVLRGTLTAAGNLQITKTPDTSNTLMYQLTALVSQWQFRPALRNSKAIDVEVLLVIPPRA